MEPALAEAMFTSDEPRQMSMGRWLALAAAGLVILIGAGSVYALNSGTWLSSVTGSANREGMIAASARQPLELLSLRHATDDTGTFVVTGLVQNPPEGATLRNVVATVYLFDLQGRYFASGRAKLDVPALGAGEESPFVVKIPQTAGVGRYRVGFRLDDGGVVAHVDRRGQTPAGTSGDTIDDPGASVVTPAATPRRSRITMGRLLVSLLVASALCAAGPQERPTGQGFSFRTSVELINVTATVTDAQGRFVPGLKPDDFEVYEDGKLQKISQFDSERVPVSLGIALDTSGSMAGEKIAAAQAAVNRFLYDLLGEQDEVFLYRFDSRVALLSGWTDDRRAVGRMLGSIQPTAARRCTTPWPRRCRWPSAARAARRRCC